MLELREINKFYGEGDSSVHALKDASLVFRKSEFVSVLGPSGCGKTTMLNILGGLDRYTSGDLMIDGKSTNLFTASDWDAYRNNCVGFVFQNYNLISHQTILENVEIALALSGVTAGERRERAIQALDEVGLKKHMNKKPNQLSGGQMQRVAIARAIVNNPEIILADEPTGALDSKNSVQIIEILKEISKTRLVVMVTHNVELAEQYSDRIINMLDGEIIGDTDPYTPTAEELDSDHRVTIEETVPEVDPNGKTEKQIAALNKKRDRQIAKLKKAQLKKTSMSFVTAFRLSLKNLFTKRGRTFLTAFAGSIGIIGIALVLAVSNGFSLYIEQVQTDVLGSYPLNITQQSFRMNMNSMMGGAGGGSTGGQNRPPLFPDDGIIQIPESEANAMQEMMMGMIQYNKITGEFVDYMQDMPAEYVNSVSYDYDLNFHMVTKEYNSDGYKQIDIKGDDSTEAMYQIMQLMTGMSSKMFSQMQSKDFVDANYEILQGHYPNNWNEVVLVVDEYNQVSKGVIESFALGDPKGTISFSDVLNKEFRLIHNDDWYGNKIGNKYAVKPIDKTMYDNGEPIKIVGVMRIKEQASARIFNSGIVYLPELATHVIKHNQDSVFGRDQLNQDKVNGYNLDTGTPIKDTLFAPVFGEMSSLLHTYVGFTAEDKYDVTLQRLGLSTVPTNIYIYPTTFEAKEKINEFIADFDTGKNPNKPSDKKYFLSTVDPSAMMSDMMLQIVDIISIVLVCFASVSLIVSSIMIGIITYVSVVERTKEIGILRSIGARKKDIGRVFNAETLTIGFAAGLIGVIASYILTIPINLIIKHLAAGVVYTNIAILNPLVALLLVVISMTLTFIAGLIPSGIASRKDPVIALRTE